MSKLIRLRRQHGREVPRERDVDTQAGKKRGSLRFRVEEILLKSARSTRCIVRPEQERPYGGAGVESAGAQGVLK